MEEAWLNESLVAGERAETWWTLGPTRHVARMTYSWNATSGRSASGGEDVTVDLIECPLVSRVGFVFEQHDDGVGHTYEGRRCVVGDE